MIARANSHFSLENLIFSLALFFFREKIWPCFLRANFESAQFGQSMSEGMLFVSANKGTKIDALGS